PARPTPPAPRWSPPSHRLHLGNRQGGRPQELCGATTEADSRARSNKTGPQDHAPGVRLLDGLEEPSSNDVGGRPPPIFTHDRASRQGIGDYLPLLDWPTPPA